MSYLATSVQERLQTEFQKNAICLSFDGTLVCASPKNKTFCIRDKVAQVVRNAGFCPIMAGAKRGGIAFTVLPHVIQDSSATYDELSKLFHKNLFVRDPGESVQDPWNRNNDYRDLVTKALNNAFSEIVHMYANPGKPILEIGSGIGYSLSEEVQVIRTQPNYKECYLLSADGRPVYKRNIEQVCKAVVQAGKKVGLVVAVNVFDELSPEKRKESLLQIAQALNSDGHLIMLHDCNPLINTVFEELKKAYPRHAIFPYCPLPGECFSLSAVAVPEKYGTIIPDLQIFWQMMNNASELNPNNDFIKAQNEIRKLQVKHGLEIIDVEAFYVKQVKSMLEETGYDASSHYYAAFTEVNSLEKYESFQQKVLYKAVSSGMHPLRQWDLADPTFARMLEKRGLSVPDHFQEQAQEQNQTKILGAEVLVIVAKKI